MMIITKIIKFIYKCLLTINATFLLIVVFYLDKYDNYNIFSQVPYYIQAIFLLGAPIITTWLTLYMSRFLPSDDLHNETKSIELVNNAYLPSYIGYFFVAVSVNNFKTLCVVYVVLVVFTLVSTTHYFNPILLLFKYNFYNIITADNIKILIITRKTFRTDTGLNGCRLKRINDFTFIDVERK